MIADLRLALRSLARRPAFAAVAVVSIALAAGANSAVFRLLDANLRPAFGVVEVDRLAAVTMRHERFGIADEGLSVADYLDLAQSCSVCDAVAVFEDEDVVLGVHAAADHVSAAKVSANLFDTLRVQPALGRGFLPAEGRPGARRALVISDGLWAGRFGRDPGVLGRAVTINGEPATIVGVAAAGFHFPESADLWLPVIPDPTEERSNRFLGGTVVRLARGVGLDALRAELSALGSRLAERHPATNEGWSFAVQPFWLAQVGPGTLRSLTLMQGAVALILLMACANVTMLMLARELSRNRQAAIRVALGASRFAVVRQVLVESVVLSLAGAALGLVPAAWGLQHLVASNPDEAPYWLDLSLGWEVALATAALAVVAAVLVAIAPALRLFREDLHGVLREGGTRSGQGPSRQRLQSLLVVGQIGLAMMLLFGASLLVGTSRAILKADIGFATEPLLMLRTFLAGDRHGTAVARAEFLARAVERLEAIPGVQAAAFTGAVPADDGGGETLVAVEAGAITIGEAFPVTFIGSTAGLLHTLGAPVHAGRELSVREASDEGARVAIVNDALAARLWPGQDAVGRRLRLGDDAEFLWLTVVGVAGSLQYEEIGEEGPGSRFQVHVPYALVASRETALMLRTSGDPAAMAEPVRRALAELDPGLAIWQVRTMAESRRATSWGERTRGRVFGAFAVIALVLGGVGVYGLMASFVADRSREIGVRLAVGATRRGVLRLLLGRGLRLALAGVLVGAVGSVLVSPLLRRLLWGVSALDRWTLIAAAATLLGVALATCYLGARSARRIEPMIVLRNE